MADARPDKEDDLDRFFALSLDLLCIAGLDGFFKRVNPSWTRVLGWSETELLARPVSDFMHPDDRERTLQARERLARGIPVLALENRYLCKDGSFRWLSWQSSLYRENNTVFAVARDITERRQVEQEHLLQSKLESTGILAGGIAHDFNNLLASLMLNLEMAQLVGPVTERQAQHMRQAQDSVRAGQELTRQLVSFSQGSREARRRLDFEGLLCEVVDRAFAGSAVRPRFEIPHVLWRVEAEETQLRQAIHNLALNARDAMPAGGSVNVSAGNVALGDGQVPGLRAGRYINFALEDRGAGIAPETQAKVFDPYFSTKERGPQKGMGLGLSVCHAILRRHGGQITVDSRPGFGTTVRCHLPASPLDGVS